MIYINSIWEYRLEIREGEQILKIRSSISDIINVRCKDDNIILYVLVDTRNEVDDEVKVTLVKSHEEFKWYRTMNYIGMVNTCKGVYHVFVR